MTAPTTPPISLPRNSMPASSAPFFDHEKLEVYRESIALVAWLNGFFEQTPRAGEIRDQLERASSSISLNITEGNGKFASKDRCRYFDIAHSSALECTAAMDVLVARKRTTTDTIRPAKESLVKIVRMLIGLIKRHSNRDYDKNPETQ